MESQFEFIIAREAQLMYRRAKEFEPVGGNLTKWRGTIPGHSTTANMKFEVEIDIPPDFPRQAPQVHMVTPTVHPQVDPNSGLVNLRILTYWRPDYHLYQVVNSLKGLFARIPPEFPDTFTSTIISTSSSASSSTVPTTPTIFQPPLQSLSQRPHHPTAPKQTPPIEETPTLPEESPKILDLKGQISNLESELHSLQQSLIQKEEQVARLEGRMDAHNVPRHGSVNNIVLPKNEREKQILDLQSEKIAVEDLIRTLEDKFECCEISATEYSNLYKSYQKQLFLVKEKLKKLGAK